MDLRGYLQAVRKSWWIIALAMVLGAGGAALMIVRSTPVYAAHLTFYVGTTTVDANSPGSTSQFAQDQATSLADVVSGDQVAARVVKAAHLKTTAGSVAGEISGSAKLNTQLINVTISDPSSTRALAIASALGAEFPKYVTDITKTGATPSPVKLTVTSGPTVGSTPVSPRKKLDLLIGIAIGLVIGLALAVLREVLDTAIRTTEVLTRLTGLPVLGDISYDTDARRSPLFIDEKHGLRRSEEFRHLRTNINFMNAAEPVKVLVVTSSIESEGKSSTAANLAVVTAETDVRVLLIEADLRQPAVSSYLGLERGSGLTNVLAGQVDVDDVLQSWGGENLRVLASGPLPPNPSELLGSRQMAAMLADMRTRFDMIIIDTPPVLPVTDAAVVSRHADGVVVVVRHKTKRQLLQNALRDLETVDARVLGTVLSMRPQRGVDSSYRGSSYYASAAAGQFAEIVDRPGFEVGQAGDHDSAAGSTQVRQGSKPPKRRRWRRRRNRRTQPSAVQPSAVQPSAVQPPERSASYDVGSTPAGRADVFEPGRRGADPGPATAPIGRLDADNLTAAERAAARVD